MYFHDCEIRGEAEHYCIDFARSKIKYLIYDINASTRVMRLIAIFIELLADTKVNKRN